MKSKSFSIAFTGYHGFIASELRRAWSNKGYTFFALDRNGSDDSWRQILSTCQIIINLSGYPVMKSWTSKNREKILNSRVLTTRRLISILNELSDRSSVESKILISASAIGIYPNEGESCVDEYSLIYGRNFLSQVVQAWESEVKQLLNPSIRCVIPRIGIVLSRRGGMIKRLWPLFRIGLGGTIGSGHQKLSFIHLDDLISAFSFFIEQNTCSGIYNLVAPYRTTQAIFTQQLAQVARRRAWLHYPDILFQLIYGQASELLLKGECVVPSKLIAERFDFRYPTIEKAILALK